jgi:ActR/RegA family two-component response regulator
MLKSMAIGNDVPAQRGSEGKVNRMVVVEADEDLGACVVRFFEDRYAVTRVSDLDSALEEIGSAATHVLFAAIDVGAARHVARIEALRRRHPDLRIVVSHLEPGEAWERARLRECADLVVRKPYQMTDVDRFLLKRETEDR